MKKSKYSDSQIVSILMEAEAGQPVKEVCRKYGISSACHYRCKSKFGGLSVSELIRSRELEADNAKLKRMYADLALEITALKDLIKKMYGPPRVRNSCVWRGESGSAQMYPACWWISRSWS